MIPLRYSLAMKNELAANGKRCLVVDEVVDCVGFPVAHSRSGQAAQTVQFNDRSRKITTLHLGGGVGYRWSWGDDLKGGTGGEWGVV